MRTNMTSSTIYIKNLIFDQIDIVLTFRGSPGHLNLSTKNALTNLGVAFGLTLASIDSAKIKLSALKHSHYFGASQEITSHIITHYSHHFKIQVGKIFGSMDILGNPVSEENKYLKFSIFIPKFYI